MKMAEGNAVKIPQYIATDPMLWFCLCESAFELGAPKPVTDSRTKYNYIVTNLPTEVVSIVRDVIVAPDKEDPYQFIKTQLIKRTGRSSHEDIQKLFDGERLSGKKPTELRMLQSRTASHNISGNSILEFFIRYLPSSVQTRLSVTSPLNLEKVADTADRTIKQVDTATVVERTGKLDVGEFELQLFDSRYMLKGESEEKKWKGWVKPSCIPITIILVLIILVVLLPLIGQDEVKSVEVMTLGDYDPVFKNCSSPCTIALVESIPENLTFSEGEPVHTSVFESWSQLIGLSERSIDIATFYSTLKGQDVQPDNPDPSSWQGDKIFSDLMKAGTERGIRIRIIQSEPTESMPDYDTKELEVKGAAKVRSLNFKKMLGAGVLHTKMFLIDKKHFYIGSANMDWRSLTQVKELGIVIYNCSCLAQDLYKVFEVYWKLGVPNPYIPPEWPADVQTTINKDSPVTVNMNSSQILTYISSSPSPLCPKGRTTDLDSILDTINRAHLFVYVAVMDYYPSSLYMEKDHYWPVIDDALRQVTVIKKLQVRILASYWNHTRPTMMSYLRSLNSLNSDAFDIEVKLFVVPAYTEAQAKIPFARVNHNKYMVTDNAAYIGTSNWAEDYFVNTGGVGIVFRNSVNNNTELNNPIRDQIEEVFKRDWASKYAHPLSEFKDITNVKCLLGVACEIVPTTAEPFPKLGNQLNKEDALYSHGMNTESSSCTRMLLVAVQITTIFFSTRLLVTAHVYYLSVAATYFVIFLLFKNSKFNIVCF